MSNENKAPDRPSNPTTAVRGTGKWPKDKPPKPKRDPNVPRPPRPGSAADVKAKREAREKAIEAARIAGQLEIARKLDDVALKAVKKLDKLLDNPDSTENGIDSAFVAALRLALQAAGCLKDKLDVTSKGKELQPGAIVVVRAADAPGTLAPQTGDDD